MDIELLVNLTSRAWSLKILALLQGGVPGRQAPLIAASKASRTAFAASLDHLFRLGLLERNPGYGHPLRPEFRLTERGSIAAVLAGRVAEIVPDDNSFALVRRSWTVPILAVTAAPTRFSTIRDGLAPITDRALSQSLVTLEKQNWIRREIDVSQRVPFPTYRAVNAGHLINRAVGVDAPSVD